MLEKSIKELLTNQRFAAVLDACLEEEELMAQFERIYGISRPPIRRTPIEYMVDEATGFRQSQWEVFFSAFIPFVYEVIWLRWRERDNEECWDAR